MKRIGNATTRDNSFRIKFINPVSDYTDLTTAKNDVKADLKNIFDYSGNFDNLIKGFTKYRYISFYCEMQGPNLQSTETPLEDFDNDDANIAEYHETDRPNGIKNNTEEDFNIGYTQTTSLEPNIASSFATNVKAKGYTQVRVAISQENIVGTELTVSNISWSGSEFEAPLTNTNGDNIEISYIETVDLGDLNVAAFNYQFLNSEGNDRKSIFLF